MLVIPVEVKSLGIDNLTLITKRTI